MTGASLFQLLIVLWAWLIPVLLILVSGGQKVSEKIPWVLMVLPLSWIALIAFYFHRSTKKNQQLNSPSCH